MIPKIIHQIHLGDTPLSEEEIAWMNSWKHFNPEWKMILWDDSLINNFSIKNKDQLNRCKNYSEKSDILRFEILYEFGGLYVDTDFECLKNIDNLILKRNFTICRQSDKVICGAFIASSKQNEYIKNLVDGIVEREKTHGRKDSAHKYGPAYITDVLGIENSISSHYVYPYLWTEKNRRNENFKKTSPESYAVHHWRESWLKNR